MYVPKIAFMSLVRRNFWKAPHVELIGRSVEYNTFSLISFSSVHNHPRLAAKTHSAKGKSLQHGDSLGDHVVKA